MIPINKEDVSKFVEKDLKQLLAKDIERHLILKEDDLQYRVYFHIQSYFEEYDNFIWRILNKPYLKFVKKYPDLLIIENMKPQQIIELKDLLNRDTGRVEIERDIDKIRNITEKYNTIFRGYIIFISDLVPSDYSNLVKKLQSNILEIGKGDSILMIPLNLRSLLQKKNVIEWRKEREKLVSRNGGI